MRSDVEKVLLGGVLVFALWLLWSGRKSSPRNQEADRQLADLYAKAQQVVNKEDIR